MTDQMIPADKVREIIASYRGRRVRGGMILDALTGLLPAPTLADMTPDERASCQWMQADIIGGDEPLVITRIDQTYWSALILDRNGRYDEVPAKHVTPRPDLPRMTWPGDQKPAPAPALPGGWRLADHKHYGRVIVTTTEPDQDGDIFFVYKPNRGHGSDTRWCKPAALTFLDGPTTKGAGTTTGPDDLTVGTVIESADDPRIAALPVGSILIDRHEEATAKGRGDWTGAGYIPIAGDGTEYGPWTVLHIPKEADQ